MIVRENVPRLADAAVQAFTRRMERLAEELPVEERRVLSAVLAQAGLPALPSPEEDDPAWWAGDVGY
jgi:hypothetical protein